MFAEKAVDDGGAQLGVRINGGIWLRCRVYGTRHEQYGDWAGLWMVLSTLTGRKSGQTVGVHVDSQWIYGGNQHVEAEVKFAAVDK